MLKYYDEISYFIQKLTGDKNLAKDLTQDTYVKVLQNNSSLEDTLPKAYLYKIAKNLVIDKVRKDKLLTQVHYEEDKCSIPLHDMPDEIVIQENRKEKLKKCIQNLSSQNKKAFVLYYYKGYTRIEIAELMQISRNAVEKNITRATLKIKEQMKKDES